MPRVSYKDCHVYDINSLVFLENESEINKSLRIMYMICDSCDEMTIKANKEWKYYPYFLELKQTVMKRSESLGRFDYHSLCQQSIQEFKDLCVTAHVTILSEVHTI